MSTNREASQTMKRSRIIALSLGLVAMAGAVLLAGCPPQKSPETTVQAPAGQPGQPSSPAGAKETIRQIGSNTILPLAEKWREAFNKLHPDVDLAVSGGGSGTGIKSLISKSCEIADSSREMKDKEIEEAKAAGVNPVQHLVAYDGIAVVVNPANPLTQITVEKLSDIYTGKTTNWDAAGAQGLGDIQVVNRESSSGTYDSFKEMVVQLHGKAKDRDYMAGTLNQTSTDAIKTLVAQTKSAIGYVGLGYVDSTVKVLKVVPVGGKAGVTATAETVLSGKYPISRKLYCYTDGEPTGNVLAYLDWIKGPEGQAIVKDVGYVALPK
jgi:phosphate transport system substrate-binding protein